MKSSPMNLTVSSPPEEILRSERCAMIRGTPCPTHQEEEES
jgi:hypothetical protein